MRDNYLKKLEQMPDIVSLGVVLVVCRPLKKRHLVLFVLLCTIFVAAILIMPEFFGILPLKALFR